MAKTTNYELPLLQASEYSTKLFSQFVAMIFENDPASAMVMLDTIIKTLETALTNHKNSTSNPHSVTKAQVGLGNVDNTSDADKPISTAQAAVNAAKADLVNGKVPSSQLPSYVDDCLEGYLSSGVFYETKENDSYSDAYTGETGKIYVDKDTNIAYRWSGSAYQKITDFDPSLYYTKSEANDLLNAKEYASNKTTTINTTNPSSTKYVSESAVVNFVSSVQTVITQQVEVVSSSDVKSKYHLGAFDTVDTSNADYDLITRKTGYLDLGELENWDYTIAGAFFYVNLQNVVISDHFLCALYHNIGLAYDSQIIAAPNMSMGYVDGGGLFQLKIKNTSYTDIPSFKGAMKGVILQCETISSYTEKVIKGQPINTLDVNGSEFLRDEWEKQLNLFNGELATKNGANIKQLNSWSMSGEVLTADVNDTYDPYIYIKSIGVLKAGTYTISGKSNKLLERFGLCVAGTTAFIGGHYTAGTDVSITYTLTEDTEVGIGIEYTLTGSNVVSIMLNEGDHAYPYQEFNGHIVHKKELETTKQELEQEIEEIVNEESIDVTDTKIIKVSGLDDNLAIPEESQVEISKVVCGALARNNLLPTNFTSTTTSSGVTITNNGDGSYTLNGTANANIQFAYTSYVCVPQRRYMFGFISGAKTGLTMVEINSSLTTNGITFITRQYDYIAFRIEIANGTSFSNHKIIPIWLDLHITYGSTIANYLASLSTDNALAWLRANDPNIFKYREYGNALVNTNGDLITTNRNVWDEIWQRNYFYNQYTGVKEASNNYCCSENYNRCKEDIDYYVCVINKVNWRIDILWYDINYNYISYATKYANDTVHSPSNAYYFTLNIPKDEYQSENYQHDICINVSDTSFNGQYVSHKQETQTLPSGYGIPKLVDNKLSFDGDEIIGDKFNSKYEIVDLGTIDWVLQDYGTGNLFAGGVVTPYKATPIDALGNLLCSKYPTQKYISAYQGGQGISFYIADSTNVIIINDTNYNDAVTFKTAMSGVMLVFEKAQPTQSIITPVHPMSCYKGGYELQTSDVPYTLQRNYDISIKDQVKTNVEVDREQSNAIERLKGEVAAKQSSLLLFTNVSASSWVSDNTYTGFGYKCELTCTGITANSIVEVVYGLTEALSGNYAPICVTSANKVTIYSKVNTSITIPTIKEI